MTMNLFIHRHLDDLIESEKKSTQSHGNEEKNDIPKGNT